MARLWSMLAAGAVAALYLTACTGGQSASSLPGVDPSTLTVSDAAALAAHRPTGSDDAATAISMLNALGAAIDGPALANEELTAAVAARANGQNGVCRNGQRSFVPDRRNEPGSIETISYVDGACSRVAVDRVTTFVPSGRSAESMVRTSSYYAPAGAASPIAVRVAKVQLSATGFGAFGVPLASLGYAQTESSRLSMANGSKQVVSGAQLVVTPDAGARNDYCSASAGYNAPGIASLDRSFGWEAATESHGVRVDEHGAVTFTALVRGTTSFGPIGGLSLRGGRSGATTCPVNDAAYTLDGGTPSSAYGIPMAVTLKDGRPYAVTVRGARFAAGTTLDMTTTHRAGAASIDGTMRNGALRLASFHTNEFGYGTLTVTSTGAQYRIVDWSVAG